MINEEIFVLVCVVFYSVCFRAIVSIQYLCVFRGCGGGVGLCVPELGTQRVLHSTCLVLQSREFVSARPCISSGVSRLTLSQLRVKAVDSSY